MSGIIADQVLPPGGGTISYQKPGDALDGFTLTVPAAAYPTSQTWHIMARPQLAVTLPAGVSQVGTPVVVGNDQGYTDSLVVIRLPLTVSLDTAVAAFFYDPVTRHLEMVPVAARDETSLTVVTTHFGSRFLWQPATGGSSLRALASATASFDSVTIIVAALPASELGIPAVSGFVPGTDDWEFTNWGSSIPTNGVCLGMSASAAYYFDRIKPATGKKLYEQYDHVASYDWDNPQGIRFASMVQYRYAHESLVSSTAREAAIVALALRSRVPFDVLTYQTLIVALRATARPQLFTMDQGPKTTGHAVVAYAAVGGSVKLADPNQPGKPGVTATFLNGKFQTVNLQANAGSSPQPYNRVFVLGSSAYIATPSIDAEWRQFLLGKAGDGTFAASFFEALDPVKRVFNPVGDSLSVWADQIELAWNCASCTQTHNAANMVNEAGQTQPYPLDPTTLSGRDSIGLHAAFSTGFVDFKWLLVKSQLFTLEVTSPAPALISTLTQFQARAFGKAPPHAKYVWDFGDQSGKVTIADDSTSTHTYLRTATFNVTVVLQDQNGTDLAQAGWRLPVAYKLTIASRNGLIGFNYGLVGRGGTPDPNATYRWDFGDHTPIVVAKDSNATHTWTQPGTYTVKLTYVGAYTETVQTTVRIYPGEWRLTALTLQKTVLPKPGTLQRKIEAFDSLTKYLTQVEKKPSDGMLFLADGNLWTEVGLYFQVAPAGTGASLDYWGAGSQVWMMARQSTVQFSNFQNTGSLISGSISGLGYVTLFYNPPAVSGGEFLNSVTATKSGPTLSGTLRFTLYDGTVNPAEKLYGFSAQLVP